METSQLKEYRCRCGKLLFKGTIIPSTVEVKCKRCGSTEVFNDQEKAIPVSFTVTIDGNGTITDACRAIICAGWEWQSIVGKHFSALFPLLRDAPEMSRLAASSQSAGQFEIRNNTLLLRDGATLPAESHIVPRSVDDASLGYHIFTVVTK